MDAVTPRFILVLAACAAFGGRLAAADHLEFLSPEPRLDLTMDTPVQVVGDEGRQPDLFCSSQGTLYCQSQIPEEPYRTKKKMVYPVRLESAISRDGGATWTKYIQRENQDETNIEGGMVECRDGTILLLDTFVMPADQPGHGTAELWKSHDDLRTLEGPFWVDMALPHIVFTGSSDDRGRTHAAARLHRSILEMPNGDLLTLMYARFDGDNAPAGYMPTMKKSRTVVIRSRDHGASWAYLSTVGVDSGVGTEGYGEPVFERIARGPHAGRLICVMRTGRDLYQSHSDDSGVSWSRPLPMALPGIDIYSTQKWAGQFDAARAAQNVPDDDMLGSLVDPDLIQLQNGVLVCAVGVRVPAKKFFGNWRIPENGNTLVFSLDGGDTWTGTVRFRSGQPTTQYMGIRESSPNVVYVVEDTSIWSSLGHKIIEPGPTVGFHLAVRRTDGVEAPYSGPMGRSPAVRTSLQAAVDAGAVVGAVGLVSDGGKTLTVETAGLADLAARKPMHPDTLFWIASMSKSITCTAVEMLVDEGKVKLDDPVYKYIPAFEDLWVAGPEKDGRMERHHPHHPITIRNLLDHTSGLIARSPLELPHIDHLSLRDNVRVYTTETLEFEPGTRYHYSNAGINTAGRIVELVSGQPFEDFLQQRLFGPLGMTDTTFWPSTEQADRVAKSYSRDPKTKAWSEVEVDQLSYPLTDRRRGACPAGGLFSTAGNVAQYCRMLMNHGSFGGRKYLSPERVAEMTTNQIGELPMEDGRTDEGYGFGLRVMRRMGELDGPSAVGTFGHSGAYATDMWMDTKHGIIEVWLVQRKEMPKGEGRKIINAFHRAAIAEFGQK